MVETKFNTTLIRAQDSLKPRTIDIPQPYRRAFADRPMWKFYLSEPSKLEIASWQVRVWGHRLRFAIQPSQKPIKYALTGLALCGAMFLAVEFVFALEGKEELKD